MKAILLFGCIILLVSCGTTGPVTTNPDRTTTTDGTAGSAKITEGTSNEGMNTARMRAAADSVRTVKDSVHIQ